MPHCVICFTPCSLSADGKFYVCPNQCSRIRASAVRRAEQGRMSPGKDDHDSRPLSVEAGPCEDRFPFAASWVTMQDFVPAPN